MFTVCQYAFGELCIKIRDDGYMERVYLAFPVKGFYLQKLLVSGILASFSYLATIFKHREMERAC